MEFSTDGSRDCYQNNKFSNVISSLHFGVFVKDTNYFSKKFLKKYFRNLAQRVLRWLMKSIGTNKFDTENPFVAISK